jgi:hypothetical protein
MPEGKPNQVRCAIASSWPQVDLLLHKADVVFPD